MARKDRSPKQTDSKEPSAEPANNSRESEISESVHQLGPITPERFERREADLSRAKEEIAILRNALTKRGADPEIIKRRAIVQQNLTLTAQGFCELFDSHEVPLPKSMKEAGTWVKAYRSRVYRHRIDSLISKDHRAV